MKKKQITHICIFPLALYLIALITTVYLTGISLEPFDGNEIALTAVKFSVFMRLGPYCLKIWKTHNFLEILFTKLK